MTTDIPQTQRAAVKQGSGTATRIAIQEIPVPQPGPDQILVKITYSGLCASDRMLLHDVYPGMPMQPATQGIAGHEGAGVVVAVGSNVAHLWQAGDRAGIKWIASVCRQCEFCTNGVDECQCPKQLNSGLSVAGTFQNYVATDAYYATRLPEGVKDEEAGPIMCGGITAYVACKRSAARPGQWIVLLGAGGGECLYSHTNIRQALTFEVWDISAYRYDLICCVFSLLRFFRIQIQLKSHQYARAMGMRVIAVDGGDYKRDLCLKLGAERFIDYTTASDLLGEITRITTYGAHAAIVFTGSKAGYEQAPRMLRPGSTMVAIGLPDDPSAVVGAPPLLLCARRLNIVGSAVGTLKDAEEALDFTARGLVHPVLTYGGLGDVERFIKDIKEGKLAGRAVIKVAS